MKILMRQSKQLDSLEIIDQFYELYYEILNNISFYDDSLNYINNVHLNSLKMQNNLPQCVEEQGITNDNNPISQEEIQINSELNKSKSILIDKQSIQYGSNQIFAKADKQFVSSMADSSQIIPFLFYVTLDNCLVLHTYKIESNYRAKVNLYEVSSVLDIDATAINNLIIICGGSNKGKDLDITVGILMKDDDLIESKILDNLKKPVKCSHSLISSNNNVYCIGGFATHKHCEKYVLNKNEWTDKIPPLNFNNYLITGCVLKEQFLFAFGGYLSESIERLDLELEDLWVVINLHPNDTSRYWSLCMEISPGIALIIGGSGENNKLPKIYNVDESDYSLIKTCEIISDYHFNGTKGLIYKNKLIFVSPYEEIQYEMHLSDWEINQKKLDF